MTSQDSEHSPEHPDEADATYPVSGTVAVHSHVAPAEVKLVRALLQRAEKLLDAGAEPEAVRKQLLKDLASQAPWWARALRSPVTRFGVQAVARLLLRHIDVDGIDDTLAERIDEGFDRLGAWIEDRLGNG